MWFVTVQPLQPQPASSFLLLYPLSSVLVLVSPRSCRLDILCIVDGKVSSSRPSVVHPLVALLGVTMYPMLISCTQSSRFFWRVSSRVRVPLAASSFLSSRPSRPASDLNPLTVVSVDLRPSSFYRRCHAASAILILPASAVLVTSIPSPPPFGCRLSVLRCSYSCASSPHCLIFTPASDSVSISPLSWAVCAPPLFFISSIPPLLLLLSWSVAWISRCYVKASRSPPLGGDVLSRI